VADHARDGRRVEEVRAVGDRAGQPLRALGHRERQVELRRVDLDLVRAEREARQVQRLARNVVQDEHHLEERRVAQAALGLELLDQLLEGQVLMRVGAEADLARAPEHLLKRRVAGRARAQDERVDEEADERLGLALVAPGDGRADAHLSLPRVAREQDLEGRQKRHEQRGALLAAERLELLGEGRRQREGLRRAAVA
jgi:hypothetical protein